MTAIEIDPAKVEMFKNNAQIYACDDSLNVVCNDFLKADISGHQLAFLSPPWGGVNYKDKKTFIMTEGITPPIRDILNKVFSNNFEQICLFLPRNISIFECCDLIAEQLNIPTIEISFEKLHSGGKIKAFLVCFKIEEHHFTKEQVNFYLTSKKVKKHEISKLVERIWKIGFREFLLADLKSNSSRGKSNPKKIIKLLENNESAVFQEDLALEGEFSEAEFKRKLENRFI